MDEPDDPPPDTGVVIVIWKVCEVLDPVLSVTEIANVYNPAVVGAPLSAPLGSRVKPAGRFPLLTAHWYGGVPPEAVSVIEAVVPTAAFARLADVVIVSGAGGGVPPVPAKA